MGRGSTGVESRDSAAGEQATAAGQSTQEVRQIAAAVQAARRRAGMTQVEVARAMGTTQSVIASLESGRVLPRLSTLQRFARATESMLNLTFPSAQAPAQAPRQCQAQPAASSGPDPRHPVAWLQGVASRRRLLGGVAGLAVAAGVIAPAIAPAAARAQTPAASPVAELPVNGTQPDGSWVFTDDRGITVRLPQPPARVFANLNAAAPLWDFGVRPVGTYASTIANDDPTWGNVDPELPNLVSDDMLDVEGLIALQPDLFVAVTWEPEATTQIWGIDPDMYDEVNAMVPIIALSTLGDPTDSIARFGALAEALGADLDAPEVVSAREGFTAAIADLTAAAAAKPDISVLFTYIPAEGDWLAAITRDWPELKMYARLGLNIVSGAEPDNMYWESISREEALKYPADVVMSSALTESLKLDALRADPTFGQHPAVKAGQVGSWRNDFIMSYQGITEPLRELTRLLDSAADVA